jgi:holliday junction DNA helicase RuvA
VGIRVIGWLRGRIVALTADGAAVVDVRDVGYRVHVASSTLAVGEEVELFVHTAVREDAIVLYGFGTTDERDLFELLLAAPGVGPATALGALRTLSVETLARAIEAEDVATVALIPGVGTKTASRIVLELKGRLPSGAAARPPALAAVDDALRALGYSAGEIRDALAGAALPEDESAALRAALRLVQRP